jgi:hypothetical protein
VASAVNGRPAIHLDGKDDFLQLPALQVDYSAGFTALVVFDWQGPAFWARVFDFSNGPDKDELVAYELVATTTLNFKAGCQASALGGLVGGFQLWEFTAGAGDTTIHRNTKLLATGPSCAVGSVMRTTTYLGKSAHSGDSTTPGRYAELLFYNRKPTQTERALLQKYLTARYGTAVGP